MQMRVRCVQKASNFLMNSGGVLVSGNVIPPGQKRPSLTQEGALFGVLG